MFRALADLLHTVGGILAAIVTFPFRLLARLFGGMSVAGRDARRGRRRSRTRRKWRLSARA